MGCGDLREEGRSDEGGRGELASEALAGMKQIASRRNEKCSLEVSTSLLGLCARSMPTLNELATIDL